MLDNLNAPQSQAQPTRQMPIQMPANSPMALMQQYRQFKSQFAGQNPRQVISQMLQTGQVTQQQLQQRQAKAASYKQSWHL